uniref:PKD domain-containing protein n=1 Tax=Corethron hystrix TaxID=216773 RepID=A0A7S1BKZ6_9STRA
MTGAAYFFEFNSTSNMWKEAQKVVAEDGRANDTFGYSVQIIGDVAAIGARANSGRGFVYIFARLGGGKWVQTHKLSGEGVEELDSFGYSLSMSNDTIVVGDPNQNGKNGVVYIFTRGEAVEWIKTQEITMEGKANYSFGESLAVFGEILVIGAKYEYYGNAADVGATYLFSRNKEGKWLKTNKYVIGHGREGTTFGSSVSAYKNSIIIGAEGDDGTKGSIYVTGLEC